MHFIVIPSDISLVQPISKEEIPGGHWKFTDYVVKVLLSDKHWAANRAANKAANKIEEAMNTNTNGVVPLEDADWRLLCVSAETPPDVGLAPFVTRQLVSFQDAICEAKEKAPVEVVADAEKK